jgi:hypothetical protein
LYPQALERVKTACLDYQSRRIGIEQLQFAIWNESQQITAHEEKELRQFHQDSEGELDLLRYTVDDECLFDRTMEIVTQIQEYVRKWE